ncbi:MAG: exonuclease domain-containing protein [Verrucomicrobiales bacterium]|nr:exonuclease domain-containing protein [Verrucomicrobiales bacterium]
MEPVLIIIDLEATCCDDSSFPRSEMEIIEIGAVAVLEENGKVESEFGAFVRPIRNPKLHTFCTRLTSITQSEVDGVESFPIVMKQLVGWLGNFNEYTFCSWGAYDKNQFLQDCSFHQVPFPFGEAHRNLKKEFSSLINPKRKFGLGGAIRHLNLEFEGIHHRGIDDARNIARVYAHTIAPRRLQ